MWYVDIIFVSLQSNTFNESTINMNGIMKKQVTMTAMMIAMLLLVPTRALCQTTVTAGKNVQSIGVTAADEGAQEVVTQIQQEDQSVTAAEGSTVRVTGNAPQAGKVAQLKLTISKDPESEVVKVQSIQIRKVKSVEVGKKRKMKAIISPPNANNRKVMWSVKDCNQSGNELNSPKNYAKISSNGTLSGLKKGYVKVIAMANDGSGVTGSTIVKITRTDTKPVIYTEAGFNSNDMIDDYEWTALSDSPDTDATKAIKKMLKDASQNGDALSVLPANIEESLGEEYNTVNEMVTVKFPIDSKRLKFKKSFQTPYNEGESLYCLLAIPKADDEVEWISVKGVADGDGCLCMTLTVSEYNNVAGKEIVLIPVSKAKK